MSLNRLLAPVITAAALALQSGCPTREQSMCLPLKYEVDNYRLESVRYLLDPTPERCIRVNRARLEAALALEGMRKKYCPTFIDRSQAQFDDALSQQQIGGQLEQCPIADPDQGKTD